LKAHKTKDVVIKVGKVDEGIAPVVNWLNSFDSIFTFYSCEGDFEKNGNAMKYHPEHSIKKVAYVLFHCSIPLDLIKVCSALGSYGQVIVDYYNGSLRYKIEFDNKQNLTNFIKEQK
jgi:tRNA(Phe) wybutosine-synthesizing methylase Tyw3